jgi:predicted dehydrogenase
MAGRTTRRSSPRKRKPIRGRKVRVCVIGAGGMATQVHYPSLATFKDVEFAGVCDVDPVRLHATCDTYRIPKKRRYEARGPMDYRAMIESEKPDGVYVIGQPHIMFDIWTWCLERGLPLYIEKPMGLTMHQARVLAHLAEENNCITQVSHQRRSCPLLTRMHAECLKRGPITYAVCEFYKHGPAPFLGARDHMMDDCTHSVDTLRWMCGGEVVDIVSHCKRVGTPDINWIGALLQFDNGATGWTVSSWCSGRRVLRVQMHAPGIYVDAEVEGTARLYADGDYTGVEYDTRAVAGSDETRVFGGFEVKNREFIDSLKTGRDVTSSPFRDCVKTMEACETILAQALLDGV